MIAKRYRKTGKEIDLEGLNRDVSWRLAMAEAQRRLSEKNIAASIRVERCPVCKSARRGLFTEIYKFRYFECKRCGHIFCDRVGDEDSIKKIYTGEKNSPSIQSRAYVDARIFKKRVKMIARPKVSFVDSIIPGRGLWVDIGCGTGEILCAARESGWKVMGFEIDDLEIEFAVEKRLKVVKEFLHCDNIANYAPILRKAAVVSLFNLLEHLPEPQPFLRSLSKHLSDKARLAIEVPRHPSLSSFNCASFPDVACRHIYPPDHLHIFTEDSLMCLLKGAGFRIERIWTFGQDIYDLLSCISASSKGCGNIPGEDMRAIIPKLQRIIDEELLSDTMLVVAKRL